MYTITYTSPEGETVKVQEGYILDAIVTMNEIARIKGVSKESITITDVDGNSSKYADFI